MSHLRKRSTRSARLRDALGHPVVDGDGHYTEPIPMWADFVRDLGRSDLVDALPMIFKSDPERLRARRELSTEERRRGRIVSVGFWTAPGDAEYFATVTSPGLYYERLGEAGIDFSVLYPTIGLTLLHLADDEQRTTLCRFFNEFTAELYRPYRDRFTVSALVPMGTPGEALAAMTHAKDLGAKVALIPSFMRREGIGSAASWLDPFGIDSIDDYDPVWARAIELGFPLATHSPSMGLDDRSSATNFMFNQIGHFAASGEMFAKALFFGGVTQRFPDLRVALLEGGVAVGVRIYLDIVSRWHKRGGEAIGRLNPANVRPDELGRLLAGSDPRLARCAPEDLIAAWGDPDDGRDDFALAQVRSEDDIRERFANLYWGCEGDDPLVGVAFDPRIAALGARLPAIFGSDIAHWDVPEFDAPLAEAYELVERGFLDEDAFREFVLTNALRCYGSLNPEFFTGTAVEEEAKAVLGVAPGHESD
jgi:predicted TIM-barrel fold metal-dependent hydrolase